MANGNGNSDCSGNGNEAGEFVVSSIRAGMKREFAMMMKAQAECGITMGQRRVTRSQNSTLIKKSPGKNVDFSKNSDQGLKGFSMRKKKKGDNNGVAEEDKILDVVDVAMLGDDGEKKKLVAIEEEETKSDIVDANSDEERKGDKDGVKEKTVIAIDSGAEEAPESVEMVGLESEDRDANKVAASNNETGISLDNGLPQMTHVRRETSIVLDNRVPQKTYFRRKSALKRKVEIIEEPKVEAVEKSKVEEVMEQSGKMEEVVEQSGKVEKVPEQSGKMEEVPEHSGRVEEVPEQSGKMEQVLEESGKVEEVPKQSGKMEEDLEESGKVEEVMEESGTERLVDEEVPRRDSLVPAATSTSTSYKLETNMSKKVELSKIPTKLKDLLETGLLEGLSVRYVRGLRVSKHGETPLRGVIQGNGILCFCNVCNGVQNVTPNQFELHAGSGNKRPPEYIYLENGKTLRDVLNACKLASRDSLDRAIQIAIGRLEAEPIFCRECKGQASLNDDMLCDSCISVRESQQKTSESSDINARTLLPVPSTRSVGEVSSKHSKSHSQGKLTKKDLGLHKLIFQSDLVPDGTPLAYYVQGKQLNTGYKSGSGIFCYCCNQVVSPSLFEAHAGCASRRKPYLQIYTPDGQNLHDISVKIKLISKDSKGQSTDQNDDVCSICEGTGELLCCDLCPRAFHKECVNLASIPEGDWLCRYCLSSIRTRNMGENANAIAAGRVPGADPLEEVRKRCVRIIGAVEPEVGGCVLCRGHDFSKADFGPRTVILCDQCEREYHVGCLKDHGMDDLKELPNEKWFCCRECSSIHLSLQQLVNDGEKRLPDHLLSMIKEKLEANGSECESDLNISWKLFHGKMASDEDRKWLSDAVSVFHDCFDPIAESKKNSRDLIPFMIYGGSNRDQDFGGMYSMILIVNSMVVSAGIFRIFGQEMAEIPLVATIKRCQGKGYFQALFSCLESFLKSLNVRDLVLPAAHEAESIWMNKFGFVKMSAEQLKQYKRDYQMMIFQGTSVLHRTLAGVEQSSN